VRQQYRKTHRNFTQHADHSTKDVDKGDRESALFPTTQTTKATTDNVPVLAYSPLSQLYVLRRDILALDFDVDDESEKRLPGCYFLYILSE
jgi:hypothetical protein